MIYDIAPHFLLFCFLSHSSSTHLMTLLTQTNPKFYQKLHRRPTVDSRSCWADMISVVLFSMEEKKKEQKRIFKYKN